MQVYLLLELPHWFVISCRIHKHPVIYKKSSMMSGVLGIYSGHITGYDNISSVSYIDIGYSQVAYKENHLKSIIFIMKVRDHWFQ